MGFKDGTNNLKADDPDALDRFVWVGDDGDQAWMHGGTYLVVRRIRMRIESWDRDRLEDQQRVIGRYKATGAPLTGQREFDAVDLDATDAGGARLIPDDAHVRLAAPSTNGGARLLRRGYSFTDGIDPATGELDAGLFFICFQRDPRTAFIPIQTRLAARDALNEYIRHVGSAIFACPPGARPGGYVGAGLFNE
jgi:deferrochelatase/peroxidase EfeB